MATKRPEYTKGKTQAMVLVIECVYEMKDTGAVMETVERALDELRGQGTAHVVEHFPVASTYQEAARILEARARDKDV